jgi:CheY-like chemotaxis protein
MAAREISKASHILVAEDDENDVFLLRRAFQKAGLPHTLIHVRDGQEAINYLSGKNHAKLKLFLLDLKMPFVDGFDVLLWLRARPQPICLPVVVLSSSSLPDDKNRAKELGANDYLAKPTGPDDLMTLVKGLDDRWLKED